MKKICKQCEKDIKGKPLIYDDYYFHKDGSGCLTKYLSIDDNDPTGIRTILMLEKL